VNALGVSLHAGGATWLVVLGAPLLAAALLAIPRLRPAVLRVAPWMSAPAVLVALLADGGAAGSLEPVLLGARFAADEVARVFLLFTGLLWMLGGLYARGSLRTDRRQPRFFAFFLVAMAGNLGLIAAQDMATFYALFALMTFASYGLVLHSGSDEARQASVVYIAMAILGEAALFAAMVLLASASDTLVFEAVAFETLPEATRQLATILALVGLGVKVGVFGLHMWLPLAHPAAPTPASAVLSGAMIKAGAIGWLRFLPVGRVDLPELGAIVVAFGLLAAFGAVVIGLAQANPKTVLAYSSVSQMGLATVALGVGMTSTAVWPAAMAAMLLHVQHHGLAKGALFLSVGVVAGLPSSAWRRGLMRLGLVLPAATLTGLPLTSGAVVKTALKSAAESAPPELAAALAALLPISAVGTTLLMVRFLGLVWRPAAKRPAEPPSPVMVGSWATLVGLSALVIWFWPPWLLGDVIGKAADPTTAWSLLWPVLVGAVLAGIVMMSQGLRSTLGRVRVPAGDLLAPVLRVGSAVVRVGRRFFEGAGRKVEPVTESWRRMVGKAMAASLWK
jgi:formate hydrogenlyase subunit 3/multisubunit Na+/H+ antiporter MnhD subunit